MTLLGVALVNGQVPVGSTPNFVYREMPAAQKEAYAALKSGNMSLGESKLQTLLRPGAAHADLQLATGFATMAYILRNEGDTARAVQVARLSLAKVAKPQGRMVARDAVDALLLAAQLMDHVIGDRAKACEAYEQAIGLEPKAKWAADRLQHLRATDESARQKPRANLLLQQRAAAPRK